MSRPRAASQGVPPAVAADAAARPAVPVASPAMVAKAALRRLAQNQLEPTPDNYARAFAEESGPPAAAMPAGADAQAQGQAWAALVQRLAADLDRGGKQWTAARRKDSLKRLLDGSRSDAARLQQRLSSLMTAWESDQAGDPAQTGIEDPPIAATARPDAAPGAWPPLVAALAGTVQAGLAAGEPRAAGVAAQLARLADAVAAEGATPERVAEIGAVCDQARRLFGHRHHLVEQLSDLCRDLTASLAELAEDDSWVRGQCQALQARLVQDTPAHEGAGDLSVRGVRAAAAVLAETRQHQQRVRGERQAAQGALKQLIQAMLLEVGELDAQTGRFQLATEQHAQAIAQADTVESLAGIVRRMLDDTRAVQAAVGQSQARLQADRQRAGELEDKVRQLEGELRRLSDEVATDALTQVANRRGLMQLFDTERARSERDCNHGDAGGSADGSTLAVGLIDIDNFKQLNDSLGHAAGDAALQALAGAVRERLRPGDHLARFGGEEFVVLLPRTAIAEAQQVLTRLQRSLSQALFLHEGREVFVTFSAGVTGWRVGEALQDTLERADEALYDAKRSGKNRTCIG